LKRAREAQKGGGRRLGEWLIQDGAVSEALLTRALSLQWSCPVISPGDLDGTTLSALVPRLFAESFNAVPLRLAAGKVLYIGYEERPDPILALALERMTGLRVESGIVPGTLFARAQARYLDASFAPAEFLEAISEQAMVRVLTRVIERARPVQARLIRVHDWLWLRMWRRRQAGPVPDRETVQDVIGTLWGQ
jgi:hypothetical protein